MSQTLSNTNDLLQKNSTILSHNQIQAVRILQFPSQELHDFLTSTLNANPALEGEERDLCPVCHHPIGADSLGGCDCTISIRQKDETQDKQQDGREDWDMSMQSVRGAGSYDDDDDDPLVRVSGRLEYGAGLLTSLRAMIAHHDYSVADYLVGSIDSHGLLPASIVEEAIADLGACRASVERVLAALQQLDPPGVGARSPREALLLQLRRLREQGDPHPLAEKLLTDYFHDIAAKHFREISREVGATPRIIELELNFIAHKLHPFPAHGFDPDLSGIASSAPPVRPDVVIRRTSHGFEADIVEQRRWNLRISDSYRKVRDMMRHQDTRVGTMTQREQVRRSLEEANVLLAALRQRWHTMQRVADALIDLQWDYLERGPAGLRPLTRKDVGDVVNLHESTVSRATDGKFVLLPNGKTVPFDDFFNDSLLVKDAIILLIDSEDARHPFSDEQITGMLNARGMEVARRTVAKYREELSILPSRLRRNRLAQRAAVTC